MQAKLGGFGAGFVDALATDALLGLAVLTEQPRRGCFGAATECALVVHEGASGRHRLRHHGLLRGYKK